MSLDVYAAHKVNAISCAHLDSGMTITFSILVCIALVKVFFFFQSGQSQRCGARLHAGKIHFVTSEEVALYLRSFQHLFLSFSGLMPISIFSLLINEYTKTVLHLIFLVAHPLSLFLTLSRFCHARQEHYLLQQQERVITIFFFFCIHFVLHIVNSYLSLLSVFFFFHNYLYCSILKLNS